MTKRDEALPFVARLTQENSHAALLDWPYKLHINAVSGKGKQAGNALPVAPVMLFDVSKDPREPLTSPLNNPSAS